MMRRLKMMTAAFPRDGRLRRRSRWTHPAGVIGVLLGMFIPGTSLAFSATQISTIDRIYIYGDTVHVRLAGVSQALEGCTSTPYYVMATDDINFNAKMATVLAAQMAGTDVYFYVIGCLNDFPKIVGVIHDS